MTDLQAKRPPRLNPLSQAYTVSFVEFSAGDLERHCLIGLRGHDQVLPCLPCFLGERVAGLLAAGPAFTSPYIYAHIATAKLLFR